MANLDASFKALADSNRREIVYLLAVTPSGMSLNAICQHFPISRQGISKHINILAEAGIIQFQVKGREKKCFLNPLPLQPVMDWLEFYKSYWAEKIENLPTD